MTKITIEMEIAEQSDRDVLADVVLALETVLPYMANSDHVLVYTDDDPSDHPEFVCDRMHRDGDLLGVFHTARFEWSGGAYINVSTDVDTAFQRVVEVINVWDDETDTPRIPLTQEAFEAAVDEWLADGEFWRALAAGNY